MYACVYVFNTVSDFYTVIDFFQRFVVLFGRLLFLVVRPFPEIVLHRNGGCVLWKEGGWTLGIRKNVL